MKVIKGTISRQSLKEEGLPFFSLDKKAGSIRRMILAFLLMLFITAPAYSYDSQVSPTEDTFTDSFYHDDAMGDPNGIHYRRLWAGPVINMRAAEELDAGGNPTGHYIPGVDGTEFTHTYIKFDLTAIKNIDTATIWIYRSPDNWGYNGNLDLYPPPDYLPNDTYEYVNPNDGKRYYKYNDLDTGDISAYFVKSTDNWDAETLKWDDEVGIFGAFNDPNNYELLSTTHIAKSGGGDWYFPDNKGWFSWDVTAAAKQALLGTDGNKTLTLAFAYDGAPLQTFHIFFSSRSELGTEELRPYLGVDELPPAVTGTIKDSKNSSVIANATVKLYDAGGTLIAQTNSDTDGNFTYPDIPSGDYNLVISKAPYIKDKTVPVTIVAGTPLDVGAVLIDPYGIVYDAVTGSAISGATVSLYTASGSIYTGCPEPNPQSSRGDGSYNFNVAPGTYYLTAAKEGYANYTSATFTVTTEVVEWNIPMNPDNLVTSGNLSIVKQANKKVASAGDIITYTVNSSNLSSTLNATGVVITDTLPVGFQYVPGSTFVDGQKIDDPAGTRTLTWNIGTLNVQTTKKMTYRVRVTPEAGIGKSANRAIVNATIGGAAASAGPSVCIVEIKDGLFSDKGMLIGKVFEDKNGNGIQDQYEPGLPGVSLILEDGTIIVTDKFGRYSVPNIEKGSHVVRIDQRVLPGGPFCKVKTPEAQKPDDKKEPEAAQNVNTKQASSQTPVEREAIISRRQLDDWRKEVLGLLQPEVVNTPSPSKVEEQPKQPAPKVEAKSLTPPETVEIKLVGAYSYTAKNKDGQTVMGMLDASSEADVADILHKRDLVVVSINKVMDKEVFYETIEEQAQKSEVEAGDNTVEETEAVADHRTPQDELLNRYGDPKAKQAKVRGQYRSDIPKGSKFFKIFGSETVKVNFPVKLLSESEARKEEEKDKAPNQFMLVGLGDATLGYLNGKGNTASLESDVNAPYEDGFYKDGKIKLYLKGLIKGEYLLTSAVDTSKDKSAHLFKYVDPERYYPVYGDQSSYFNETDSKGRFYVRIDKDNSYGMWGNYNTQEFTKTEFTRYNRTLSGAKTHIELKDWAKDKDSLPVKPSIDFFYSLSEQEPVSETFAAKGISGPFWLGHTPLLEYSESIRIETRDKDRSDIVLRTRTMARDVDYEIDYSSGRIFFKWPVSTRDENDDPNFIVVDYEYAPLSGANKNYLTGSRVETKMFGDKLMLGGQLIAENHVANDPRLYGFDTVLQPDPSTRLAAEWGHSSHYLDTNSAYIENDSAWKIEGSKVIGRLKLQGYYSDIGNDFSNPVNVTEKGMQKYGTTADYQLTDSTNLVFDHWRNRSTISKTFDRRTSVDIYHRKTDYFLGLGYAFQQYEDKLGISPNEDTNVVTLKGGRKLSDRFVATLEEEFAHGKQSDTATAADNNTFSTTGRLDYKLSKDSAVYVKNRLVQEQHKKYQNITSLGFSRDTLDGESYIEYGFGGKTAETTYGVRREQNLNERLTLSSYMNSCVSGEKNEENVGFGSTYEVLEGLFTKFNFENTRNKNSDASHYKQNSQSVGFDYLPSGTENSYGLKFERRKAPQAREVNILGYVKYQISNEYSFIFDSDFSTENSDDNTVRDERKIVLGFAYRPIFNDKLNFLSKYEYNGERDYTTSNSSTDYYSHIASLEGTYEISPRVDIFGKYALKFSEEQDADLVTDSLMDMATGRLTCKFTKIFDMASYYRVIYDHNDHLLKQAPALELGTLLFERLRIGVGYNFLSYKDRHSEQDYSGTGPYVNFSAKF